MYTFLTYLHVYTYCVIGNVYVVMCLVATVKQECNVSGI